jgi:hypothetical protein
VVGKLACGVHRSLAGHALDRLPDHPVQLRATCARELVVDGFADERVDEAVASDRVGLLDDTGDDRVLEALGNLVGGHGRHPLEQFERELAPGHGGDRQHAPTGLARVRPRTLISRGLGTIT